MEKNDRSELSLLKGEDGKKVYTPTTNCLLVQATDCVALSVQTNGPRVNGYVKLMWGGQTFYNQSDTYSNTQIGQKVYRSVNGEFLNDPSLLEACAGKLIEKYNLHLISS